MWEGVWGSFGSSRTPVRARAWGAHKCVAVLVYFLLCVVCVAERVCTPWGRASRVLPYGMCVVAVLGVCRDFRAP